MRTPTGVVVLGLALGSSGTAAQGPLQADLKPQVQSDSTPAPAITAPSNPAITAPSNAAPRPRDPAGNLSPVRQYVSRDACFESSILSPAPFMGNNGEVFKLADGSLWEVKYEYEYLYEYFPNVVVCLGTILVGGKSLNVQRLSGGPAANTSVIESYIDGDFMGWDGETIFKLDNRQIWQQASYAYYYSYKYHPRVIIFNSSGSYKMQVEGESERIQVNRLR
jgi:hypothetical protein